MTNPNPKVPCNKGRKMVKMSAISLAQLMKYLMEGIYSCRELAEETGLHYVTVLNYTRQMHRVGVIHICAWEKDCRGKDQIKIYAFGNKPDAKRKTMTRYESSKKSREKRRQLKMLHRLAGTDVHAA